MLEYLSKNFFREKQKIYTIVFMADYFAFVLLFLEVKHDKYLSSISFQTEDL